MEYTESNFSKIMRRDERNIQIDGQGIAHCDHFFFLGLIIHQNGDTEENVVHKVKA